MSGAPHVDSVPMSTPIKVAVLGARGRMGTAAVAAIGATEDLEVVAQLGRGDDLESITSSGATHVLDLSVPDASETNVTYAVEHGLHAVVGTTGWDEAKRASLTRRLAQRPDLGVLIAPNFALGSVLVTAFAARAARYFESVEVIELHHPNKLDAPSGTAVRTAELIAASRAEAHVPTAPDATTRSLPGARGADVEGVPVHSVRLRGLTAHQEVLLGSVGEQLSIRHDSFDHASFMPGILLGLRTVASRPGLTFGLDGYLDLGL